MSKAKRINAVVFAAEMVLDSRLVCETLCRDYDHYAKLPAAVEYRGLVLAKTGWNSDRNVAYYKSVDPRTLGTY